MRTAKGSALSLGVALVLGALASVTYADTVTCAPIPSTASVCPGFIFTVCNTPEDACTEAGCIYDLHLTIVKSQFRFKGPLKLPTGWTGKATKSGLEFVAATRSARYAISLKSKCQPFKIALPVSGQGKMCVTVNWETTGANGQVLDSGTTTCCVEIPG